MTLPGAGDRRRGARRRPAATAVALLAVGYALVAIAWVFANPVFAAPDEPSHYLRAIAVGGGHIAGSRTVTIPSHLWGNVLRPDGAPCNAGRPAMSARCTDAITSSPRPLVELTPAGAYQPLPYLVPGALMRAAADSPASGDRVGRVVSLAICVALLVTALLLLSGAAGGISALSGPLIAVSPMVLFICASLTPSGLEVAAGLAFAAALIRLLRSEQPPTTIWVAVAATGVVLSLSRTTGALWVILDVVVVTTAASAARLRAVARGNPRAAAATSATLLAAVAANRVWEAVYGSSTTEYGAKSSSVFRFLPHGVEQLPRLAREAVGVFGWLDSPMPRHTELVWLVLVAVLVVAAFAIGSRRERVALAISIVALVSIAVFLSASLQAADSGDVQARHVLPFAVVTPLIAADVLVRHRVHIRRGAFGALAVVCGALQLIGFLANARRQAVGLGHPITAVFNAGAWQPPLGWPLWIAVAAAGSVLIAGAGGVAAGWSRCPSERHTWLGDGS